MQSRENNYFTTKTPNYIAFFSVMLATSSDSISLLYGCGGCKQNVCFYCYLLWYILL